MKVIHLQYNTHSHWQCNSYVYIKQINDISELTAWLLLTLESVSYWPAFDYLNTYSISMCYCIVVMYHKQHVSHFRVANVNLSTGMKVSTLQLASNLSLS